MEPELRFRPDLYRGTAPYYDRFRPPYPRSLLDDLCRTLPVSGSGTLLDLACGTGQIALPLARRFGDVFAVDQEAEFVEYGQLKTENLGITNVTWLRATAEDAELNEAFELVTIGNAFHRLDRNLVAERVLTWLHPGGGVALLWGETPQRGLEPWQQAMAQVLTTWMDKGGATVRVPNGWAEAMAEDPHDQVLRRAGFDYAGKFEFTVTQTWSIEALTGFVYSTSFLNRKALGGKVKDFEKELAEALEDFTSDGTLYESASFAYELARKPG